MADPAMTHQYQRVTGTFVPTPASPIRIARPQRRARARLGALVAAVGLVAGLLPVAAAVPAPVAAAGETLPAGFVDQAVRTGLTRPTVVAFAPGGRVFVAEKSGIVKTWASYAAFAGATAPTTAVDIRTDVYDYWDRGLLGLTVDPGYPGRPYLYLLYTADLTGIGGTTPRWNDACPASPNGPGSTTDGCVAYARLARVTVNPSTGVASSTTNLIEDWCQQFPSHSIGTVAFGPDGMLYLGAGDGASFNAGDYGQYGGTVMNGASPYTPANPCGDPPGAAGTGLTPPTAEGGGLRAQSARRASGEPVSLDGSILRVDPDTGLAAPDNPFVATSTDPNKRRIVAYGLRNPFRFVVQPGTGDLWVGDVGYNTWEEVDRVPNPAAPAPSAPNFGWPCYEGTHANTYYGATSLNLCNGFQQAPPFYTYSHSGVMAPGDACPVPSTSSVAGLAFYGGSGYPASYQDGLFVVGLLAALPDLHRGGRERAAGREQGGAVRRRPAQPGEPGGGARQRRPGLPELRHRRDPAHPLSRPDRVVHGDADPGRRAADGGPRCLGLERVGRHVRGQVRVGLRRRRRLRRDRLDPDHVPPVPIGHLAGPAPGDGLERGDRRDDPPGGGRQHRTDRLDRRAGGIAHLGGGRRHPVRGLGDRRPGRRPSCVRVQLVVPDRPLHRPERPDRPATSTRSRRSRAPPSRRRSARGPGPPRTTDTRPTSGSS